MTNCDPVVKLDVKKETIATSGALKGLANKARNWGRPPRIIGIDLARGLAIIGMVAAHVLSPEGIEWSDPTTWAGVVSGRSSLLFAFLAGISLALLSGNPRYHSPQGRARFRLELVGRAMTIFAIGLFLELLNSGILVILTYYGLYFLCMIPFVWVSTKRLILCAGLFAFFGPALKASLLIIGLGVTTPGIELSFASLYGGVTWMTLMIAGLAFGRQDLTSMKVATAALLAGTFVAIAGYTTGFVIAKHSEDFYERWSTFSSTVDKSGSSSNYEEDIRDNGSTVCYPVFGDESSSSSSPTDYDKGYFERVLESDPAMMLFDALTSSQDHSGGTLEIVASGGFALAVVGASLLIARPLRWLLLPIACIGSMPLTSYSAHVIGFAILAGGPAGIAKVGFPTFAWTVLALLVATGFWAMVLGRGPLERLVAKASKSMAKGTYPEGTEHRHATGTR